MNNSHNSVYHSALCSDGINTTALSLLSLHCETLKQMPVKIGCVGNVWTGEWHHMLGAFPEQGVSECVKVPCTFQFHEKLIKHLDTSFLSLLRYKMSILSAKTAVSCLICVQGIN